MLRSVSLATAVLALAAPAFSEAHQSGADFQAMQDFFGPLSETAPEAVSAGDWEGIAGWMSDKVQDDAPIYFHGHVQLSAGPSASFEGSLMGEDLAAMAQMAGGPQGAMMEGLEDYDLEVQVKAAWELPDETDGETFAGEVAFYESGSLPNLPSGNEARSPFSSATVCAVRLTGMQGDYEIAAASCEVQAQL